MPFVGAKIPLQYHDGPSEDSPATKEPDYFSTEPSHDSDSLDTVFTPKGLIRLRDDNRSDTSLSEKSAPRNNDDIAKYCDESLHSFSFSSLNNPSMVETRKSIITRSIDYMKTRFQGWKIPEVAFQYLPYEDQWSPSIIQRKGWQTSWSTHNTPRPSVELGKDELAALAGALQSSITSTDNELPSDQPHDSFKQGRISPIMESPTISSSGTPGHVSREGANTPQRPKPRLSRYSLPVIPRTSRLSLHGNDPVQHLHHPHQGQNGPTFHSHSLHLPTRFLPQNQAMVTCNASWNIQVANDIACLMFGYERRALMGMNALDLIAEPFRSRHETLLRKRATEIRNLNADSVKVNDDSRQRGVVLVCGKVIPILKKDGNTSAASLWLKEKMDDFGKPIYIWIFEEIAESFVEMRMDETGTISKVSGAITDLYGYKEAELVGSNIDLIVPIFEEMRVSDSGFMEMTADTDDDDNTSKNEVTRQKAAEMQRLDVHAINKHKFFGSAAKFGAKFPIIAKLQGSPADNEAPSFHLKIISIPTIAGLVTIHESGLIQSCNVVFAKYLFGFDSKEVVERLNIAELLPQFPLFFPPLKDEEEMLTGEIISNTMCRRALAQPWSGMREDEPFANEACSSRALSEALARAMRNSSMEHLSQLADPEPMRRKRRLMTPRTTSGGSLPYIIALHRDGTTFEVQLQIRLVESSEEKLYALWITFDRAQVFAKYGWHDPSTELKQVTPSKEVDDEDALQMRKVPRSDQLRTEGFPSPSETVLIPPTSASPPTSAPIAQKVHQLKRSSREIYPSTPPAASTPPAKFLDYSAIRKRHVNSDKRRARLTHLPHQQRKVVLKYVVKSRILPDCWTKDRFLGLIPLEIHVMHTLRQMPHSNIAFLTDYFEDNDYYYIEMLLHGEGMDLFDYIELHLDMPESEIKSISRQLAEAIAHLHDNIIVHRDIKDENVVLNEGGRVQLIDFGSAAYQTPGKDFDTFCGTLDYAAPEVLQGKAYSGPPQDIWALGILFYTLLYKENPFYNIDEILAREMRVPHIVSEEETLKRHLSEGDFEGALSVAQSYDLSTDIIYQAQWLALKPDDITAESVLNLLPKVKDRFWVLSICLQTLPTDITALRTLLNYGVQLTVSSAIQLSQAETDTASPEDSTPLMAKCWLLCSQYLSRISTFQAIWRCGGENYYKTGTRRAEHAKSPEGEKEEPKEEVKEPAVAEDSEDSKVMVNKAVEDEKPDSFLKAFFIFRDADLVSEAAQYASRGYLDGMQVLFERHSNILMPYRLSILNHIRLSTPPANYAHLLPGVDPSTQTEVSILSRREQPDYSLEKSVRENVQNETEIERNRKAYELQGLSSLDFPANIDSLRAWYDKRIRDVESLTGQANTALVLTNFAIEKGITGLESLREMLYTLNDLLYERYGTKTELNDVGLAEMETYATADLIRLFMRTTTSSRIVQDVRRYVLPLLSQERPQQGSIQRENILYDWILELGQEHLDWCCYIFESSKPTLADDERIIKSDQQLAALVLAVVYGSNELDRLDLLGRIFECLPVFDEDATTDQQLLQTLIVDRPASSWQPQDLYREFKTFNTANLTHYIDMLEADINAAEILSRYQCNSPLRFFIRSRDNHDMQMQLCVRLASQAAGGVESGGGRFDNDDEWALLLDDMLRLGDPEKPFATFKNLSKEEIYVQFATALLRCGKFTLARDVLLPFNAPKPLRFDMVEKIVLEASREFYDNSTSCSVFSGNLKLARDCLQVIPVTPSSQRELDLIDATNLLSGYRLYTKPGINIMPIQIRQITNRLDLIARLLSSNPEAYKQPNKIREIGRKLVEPDDEIADLKVIAMLSNAALGDEGYDNAYDLCILMMEKQAQLVDNHTQLSSQDRKDIQDICWRTCFETGKIDTYSNVTRRLELLGMALTLCPKELMLDVLNVWRKTEVQARNSKMQDTGYMMWNSSARSDIDMASDSEDYSSPKRIRKRDQLRSMSPVWKLGQLNHVAIAVHDIQKSATFYRDTMGAQVSDVTPLPDHGVYTVFVNLGNTKIELLHPLGDQSPIQKFLDKNKDGGIHHICIEVDDIHAALKSLTAKGVRALNPEPKIGAHNKPVVFLHPKDCGGVLVEIEQK
ncbi:hypothetical protein BZG36_04642 [Bifiguratus adelaidae]|uniref:Methylmalonyl-CoA epimerase, mitochondrial n=1 Tax=Bifiguratus adelaidae TaxID=1938954 RepID=A0A261XY29_9FUNG|nr:hypothetical protein BZG36_04642 [Bifiguratus adelaidae]